MQLHELPPVYARLAGFLAGSLARRALPGALREVACRAAGPIAAGVPEPLRRGYTMGVAHRGDAEPPVLLVPGFFGPRLMMLPLAAFLRLHGRRVRIVRVFPAFGGVVAIAERIAEAIAALRAETGADQVDVVTHSMGGLAGRYYMIRLGGRPFVRRFVTVATPHKGTAWASVPLNRSMEDMRPGNPFLEELAACDTIEGVRCTNIRAGWDQIVWPRAHGVWGDHADEHELPFAEHWAILADPRLLALVLTTLEASDAAAPIGEVDLPEAAGELGATG